MSFSNDVRNELARIIPEKTCCQKAELSALLMLRANLVHGSKWGTLSDHYSRECHPGPEDIQTVEGSLWPVIYGSGSGKKAF